MDFFTHILLPALTREEKENEQQEEVTRQRSSYYSNRYWRGGAMSQRSSALDNFNDNSSETLFGEGDEDEDEESLFKDADQETNSQLSDEVSVLERRDVLLELGVTTRNVTRMMMQPPLSIRAPPVTPVEVLTAAATSANLFTSKRDIPSFIQYVTTFPNSQLYASCFIEELEGLYSRYLDQDGCLCMDKKLDSSLDHGPAEDLKTVGERLDVLIDSISYLMSVQPVLR